MGWLFGSKSERAEKARLRALELQRRKEIKLANKRAAKQRTAAQKNAVKIRFAHSLKKALPSGRQSLFSEQEREKSENFFSRARRKRQEVSEARRQRVNQRKEHKFNARADRITRHQQRREARQAEVAKRKQAGAQRHENRAKRKEMRIATRQNLKAHRAQKWDDFKYKAALFLATTPKNKR